MHNPPQIDSCLMADSKCLACEYSKQASLSYSIVRFCEYDLCGLLELGPEGISSSIDADASLQNNEATIIE